ncbi:MAG TPA: retropepsin-like aspartic protease [Pyrinomonadaceae bacterium]|jgi:predicted aspartyl protease|nr:retropepsin-like aspartic protease [Pyrinomonadaceae bacterium]
MKQKIGCFLVPLVVLNLCCLSTPAQVSPSNHAFSVPFDYEHDEIILQVKVNGLGPFNMMLDLDTDPSAIDVKTARELNLKLKEVGKRGLGGGSGSNQIYTTRLPQVAVGDLIVKDLEAVATDLSQISQKLGRPLHGVLGNSLTKNRVVQIDYPAKVVLFSDGSPLPQKQPNAAQRVTLPFVFDKGSASIIVNDVYVNDKKIKGTLDTGSDGTFKLTWAATVALGLQEEAQKGEPGTSLGYNGEAPFRKGKVKTIAIGQIKVETPEVVYFMKGGGRDDKPWGINIGNAFLKDFILTVDYRRKQIILERP